MAHNYTAISTFMKYLNVCSIDNISVHLAGPERSLIIFCLSTWRLTFDSFIHSVPSRATNFSPLEVIHYFSTSLLHHPHSPHNQVILLRHFAKLQHRHQQFQCHWIEFLLHLLSQSHRERHRHKFHQIKIVYMILAVPQLACIIKKISICFTL